MGRAYPQKCCVIYGFITILHIDAYIQIYNMKKTPLIFMQDTVNYLFKIDEKKFDRILVELGEMEIRDIVREETIRYYKFKI